MKAILKNNWLLILILIIAALLRFVGVKPGYNQFHSDEPIIYGVAVDMVRNGNLDPGRLDYGGTSIYLNYWVYRLLFIPLGWLRYYISHLSQIVDGLIKLPIAPLEARNLLQTYILGHREINVLFWGRYITAAFGLGSVFLTYLLGKKLFGKVVGLTAALFLTFNFRHVLNSHINLPDIYNSFFLLLALITTVSLWHAPTLKNYVLSGLTAGLFFSVKYQFFAFLPLLLVHLYLYFSSTNKTWKAFFSPRAFMGAAVIIVTFLVVNPYFLINFENAIYWARTISEKYSMGTYRFNLYPFSYLYHIDYGPVQFVMIILGLLFMTIKDFRKAMFLWVVIFPFFWVMTYYSYGGFYVRNFITITPLLLVVGSYFVNWLTQKIKWLALGLLVVALYVPAKNSVISVYFYTKPWNYALTAKWMADNLSANTVVAAHPFDPPGGPKVVKTEFKLGGAFGLVEHKENGAQYALINLDWASNPFYIWTNFGIKDVGLFWAKPMDILRNTYYGLVAEEMFRYQVFSATKPWQAPEAGLVLAKIPQWPVVEMKTIRDFHFEKDENGWTMTQNDQGEVRFNIDNREGYHNLGSIHVGPGRSRMGIKHLISPVIEVKAGHLYQVSGYIKTATIQTPAQRSAFLRVDYYSDTKDIGNLGMVSSISSRVFGTDDWILKEAVDRAPEGAKYLTVGLQFSESENNEVWLDDVVVKESVFKVDNITDSPPFIKKGIDLNLLYTYSHGNL